MHKFWKYTRALDRHSHPQRPRSFWSTPRIATSGKVQLRKSAIHELPVTLCMLRVKSDKSDWLRILKTLRMLRKLDFPRVAFLGADQKERGFWRGECLDRMKFRLSLFARLIHARVTLSNL